MSSQSFPTYESIINEFEKGEMNRYEPSKHLKAYFDSIKNIPERSDDLEKIRKEILLWDLSYHASPEIILSPMFTGKTGKGEDFQYPDISTFDDAYFEHYKTRFAQTPNPISKCRYGDILWQVKKDFSIIKETIVVHRDCAEIYFDKKWDNELCDSLLIALRISVSINDANSIKETYDYIVDIIGRLLSDNRPRFLIELMSLVLKSKDKIKDLNYELFKESVIKAIEIYKAEKPDSFHIQRDFYNILLNIGKANDEKELVKQSIKYIFNLLIEEANWKEKNYPNGTLIKAHFLKSALKYANDNAEVLGNEVEPLKKEIQKNSTLVKEKRFKKVETEIIIPNEKIDKFLKKFKGKETVAILKAITFGRSIIPNYETSRKNAEEQAKEFVFQHIIPVQLQQGDFTIKTISGDEEKLEYSTIINFMIGYNLSITVLMPKIMDLIKKQDKDYVDNILKFLQDAPLITEGNISLIKEGLKYYFNDENIACIHILTFQVEAILRNILKILGVPTFSFNNGEMKARMLKDVISALSSINGFEKDFVKFLEIFLIELRGENLRNNIAHGLCEYKYFDKRICDLLFIILIKIASYHIHEIDE